MSTLALATGVQPDAILPAILPALIVLFVLIVAGTIVLTMLRRSLKPRDPDSADGFTLHGLREMHARGDLDEAEFERAKAAVIERARGGMSENPDASGRDPAPPSDTTPPDGPTSDDANRRGDESSESASDL